MWLKTVAETVAENGWIAGAIRPITQTVLLDPSAGTE
jgi:hypothetical protein